MQLHEEYIGRHNLNVSVVRYDGHSNVMLRSKESPLRWRIFSIKWHDGGYHPGFFEAIYMAPEHDGYEKGNLVRYLMNPKRLYWEEYEDWVLTMTSTLKEEYVVVHNDKDFVAWRMFLIMYDKYLAKHMSSEFFVAVGKSIQSDLDFHDRMDAFLIAEDNIRCRLPDTYDSLKYQVKPLANTHSPWLEKLINEE